MEYKCQLISTARPILATFMENKAAWLEAILIIGIIVVTSMIIGAAIALGVK